jgi:hypothetical protein
MIDNDVQVSKKRYDTLLRMYFKAHEEMAYSSERISHLRVMVDDWIDYYRDCNSDSEYVKGALNSFLMIKETLRLLEGEKTD